MRRRLIGLGCMRLSGADRDRESAIAVIHAALDAGVRLLDTADVYAPTDDAIGHNERLIARALADWDGAADEVEVVTKGGLTRPGGRWRPDGRARHLQAACEASLKALGSDKIALYLLHAVDPKTPIETSARALGRLKDQGLVEAIGLSNVTVTQLERALDLAPITAVQVSMSPFDDTSLRNGVAEYCAQNGLRLLLHSPLGGPKRAARLARDKVLKGIAERRDATSAQAALAWLLDLNEAAVPIPGTTRVEHARELAAASALQLTDRDRERLDARFPAGRQLRITRSQRAPAPDAEGDVVLMMGPPAAGKTTAAGALVDRGYERLNRDALGGRLADLVPLLDERLAAGQRRLVLDNTYGSRAERNRVIEAAWRHGVPVRCLWLDTPIEAAQINAVRRMLARHGRLLGPEELAAARRTHANTFGPRAQFDYRRDLEPPTVDEGFRSVERLSFERRPDTNRSQRALFLDLDDVVRTSRSGAPTPLDPDDVAVLPERGSVLQRYAAEGWHLLAIAWQPQMSGGTLGDDQVQAILQRTNQLLGVAVDARFCPHPAGPPRCWCRKPLPGLALVLAEEYALDLPSCRLVGRSAADRTLAERLGVPYIDQTSFFAS